MNANYFGEHQQAPSEPMRLSEPSSMGAMNQAPLGPSSLVAGRAEQQKPQQEQLPEKRVLGPNDVLSGRTKLSFNHSTFTTSAVVVVFVVFLCLCHILCFRLGLFNAFLIFFVIHSFIFSALAVAISTVGNRRFREVVAQSIDDYNSAPSRAERYSIIDMVIAQVANAEGRFLKLDDATQEWEEVEHDVVRQKISHAIRDTTKKREAKKQRELLRSEKAAAAAKVGKSEHHNASKSRNSSYRKQQQQQQQKTTATPGPMAVASSNAKPVAPISELMQNLNAYMQGGAYAARVASAKTAKKKATAYSYSTTNGIPMDATPAFLQQSEKHNHVTKHQHQPLASNQQYVSDPPGFGMKARPKWELRSDCMDDMPFHPTCDVSTTMMDDSMAEPTPTRFELRQDSMDVSMAPCVSMGDDMLDPRIMMRPAVSEPRYQHAQDLNPPAADDMGAHPISFSEINHAHPFEDHAPVVNDDGFLSIINDTLGPWQPESDPFL